MRTHHNQRHRRLRVIGGVVGVLVAPALVPATAHAAGTSTAACVWDFALTLAPGASLTPADFTYTSGGESGTVTCVGTLRGHTVTGPGTIADQGTGRGSCSAGTLTGTYTMTIPTDAGLQKVRVPYANINFAGPQGVHATPGLPGGFVFAPIQGDCVTAPATKVVTQEFGVLTT